MKVYLDNAATTPLDPRVLEAMMPYLTEHFGNPSSTHSYGRTTRAAIEKVRKEIATILNCSPAEIIFTSGGTEADNMAIHCSVNDLGIRRVISSKIEHHAVSHTLEDCSLRNRVKAEWVRLKPDGTVDLGHLEELLQQEDKTLVSLMHANNEIGTLLPLKEVAVLCKKYGALLHSDTVQTVGHYPVDLADIPVDFITCAAHKFHGPKGIGFLFVRKGLNVKSYISGGAQEREKRGGTENVYGIVGLGKALEIAYGELEQTRTLIAGLRNYMKDRLISEIPGVAFNCSNNGLYTVLNVNFPAVPNAEILLFSLDIEGVACSGGSACSSGSSKGSHVLAEIDKKNPGPNIRFSFSKYNTKEEIDFAVSRLRQLINKESLVPSGQ